MKKECFEFRGVEGLVYAEVTSDTAESYETGEVKPLSAIAKLTRKTESSSKTSYYDNQPMIVVSATGSDELGLTVAPLDLETYAEITGQTFDKELGALVEGEATTKYFAIGYKTADTDGKNRYVWRYKGMFSIPDEEHNTVDNGTDTTNTELTWTGISTVYKFKKTGKAAHSIVVDERCTEADLTTFFDKVQTVDTLTKAEE